MSVIVRSRNKFKPHKTQKITIKQGLVDVGMIPIINWLNGFEDVYTQYCCEGNSDKKNPISPYVLFFCTNQVNLLRILSATEGWADTEVQYAEGSLRYYLRFSSKHNMEVFKDYLKKYKDRY